MMGFSKKIQVLFSVAVVGMALLSGCATTTKDRIPSTSVVDAVLLPPPPDFDPKHIWLPMDIKGQTLVRPHGNWFPLEPVKTTVLELEGVGDRDARYSATTGGASNYGAVNTSQNCGSSPGFCGSNEQAIASVFFSTNSYSLNQQSKNTLRKLPVSAYFIEGYADPRGDFDYNLMLSFKRAKAVADWMRSEGQSIIGIEARGEKDASSDVLSYQHDRRVDVYPRTGH